MAKIIVVGASFAGLTAAFDLRRELGKEHEVVVISKGSHFVFIPSMPWVVLGTRTAEQVSFPLAPALAKQGIEFIQDAVTKIDPTQNLVYTQSTQFHYDYLFLGTGPALDFSAVEGLGPHGGFTHSVCNLEHSLSAQSAFKEFLKNPGPLVIGATQGASCFGAGYEFLLNIESFLRKNGLRDKVKISWVTPEPFLGHFGLGGVGDSENMVKKMFKELKIDGYANHAVKKIEKDKVILDDGTELPFAYSMMIPPFKGIDAVFNTPGLGNANGFIPVTSQYRHPNFANIFAGGVNVALAPKDPTPIPTGVPKTGYMAEHMAKTAVKNIIADIEGTLTHDFDPYDMKALCILDSGDAGIYMIADPVFPPQKNYTLQYGSWVHGAKIAFEKYFIWKMKNGLTNLPI
ncbi:NAD(P)/FAD-dependent oxidoreductase [Sulfoacidibacillus thermotolerans]|uniref:Sulfide-quinone reductase n=1 Tax=Sulfoacidibacillus thermotolerans TaxID=1765684 RepID=A0A2U3D6Z1_SULT2|nr:FAD/NAD(P)-binding oxidoreductase [Sulfoacidibacillus thermotolerans]PWI57031.1 hypothetical protein BM613_10745 [Sulfoacidibacillus thermotolerans]